jgi:hypothetical protein
VKAYITQYASALVAVFNPSDGSLISKTIDLSAFNADSSSIPYMSRALYHNGKVYIACQRLSIPTGSMFPSARDSGCIVVIDAVTDSVLKSIMLAYKNPQELSICNGKLFVGSVGAWGDNDAGIEYIDLATDTYGGSVISEAAFGGDVASIIVTSDTKGYTVISTPAYTTELHAFNPQAKTAGSAIAGLDAPCSGHMAFDGTYIYVGDRSNTNPGIVAIDAATDTKVGATKNVGLPPNSLGLLEITE